MKTNPCAPKYVQHSGKLTPRNMPRISDGGINYLQDMIESAGSGDDAYESGAFFPVEYIDSDGLGGPPVYDGAVLYVPLPFGYCDDPPVVSVSLRACVDDMIDSHVSHLANGKRRIMSKDSIRAVTAVRDGLAELVRQIDEAMRPE